MKAGQTTPRTIAEYIAGGPGRPARVLLAPAWEILGEETRGPGAVVRIPRAALTLDLVQPGAHDRVATEEDRTIRAELVEARPQRWRSRIGDDPPVRSALGVGDCLEAQAAYRGALEPGDSALDGGDDRGRRPLDLHQEAHDADRFMA